MCELDIIFNFHKVCSAGIVAPPESWHRAGCLTLPPQAYYIVDEMFVSGKLCDSSKKEALRACAVQDDLMDETRDGRARTGR